MTADCSPPGLLVGQVIATTDGRLRARLAADLVRLQFLRVMRSHPGTALGDSGDLIGPPWPLPDETEDRTAPDSAPAGRSPSRQQQRGAAMSSATSLQPYLDLQGDLFSPSAGSSSSAGCCRWGLAKAACPVPISCLR